MFKRTPSPGAANAAFGNETVDMWIPFEVTAKGMQDTDKAGSKTFRFVGGLEHSEDNTAYGRKKTIQKLPVLQKERTELFGDGEDAVPVGASMSLKDMEVVLSMEYLTPQEGQPYMAPPKDGSPQWIIFSTFSTTVCLG